MKKYAGWFVALTMFVGLMLVSCSKTETTETTASPVDTTVVVTDSIAVVDSSLVVK